MRLENVVWDARDPHRLGRFWIAALGAEQVTDEPDLVEARLHLGADAFLDLCFPRVDSPSVAPPRLRLDLAGDGRQDAEQHDPEGNPFRVRADGDDHPGTGPIAALLLDSADPDRDAGFWAGITGWVPVGRPGAVALRHPAGVGPLLELRRESGPRRGKSRLHLDVRCGAGDDDLADRVVGWGATALSGPTDHPWRVFADPSGNEFCILPASV